MNRRLTHTGLAFVLGLAALGLAALGLAACDTAETTRADAERIVGTWEGESVSARTTVGVSLPILDLSASGDVTRFTFGADGSYAFLFDPADGRALTIPQTNVSIPLDQTVSFSGTYSLDDAAHTLTLSAGSLPANVTLGYAFSGDDALSVLAEDPETLLLLVGAATDDATIQLLASVVTGGSIRYARSN